VLLLALLGTSVTGADTPAAIPPGVRLTVLYDNTVGVEGTRADWGLAVLVERDGATVLFDTGTDARILEHNVRTLGVDPAAVDAVVLSHDHGDHTGGLGWVLEQHHDLVVYAPSSFSEDFTARVREAGARAVVTSEPSPVASGIHTSGTVAGDIPEQALVVETADGLLVITGCAHPGVVEIVRQVQRRFHAPVRTVVGGFHLLRHSRQGVVDVMDRLQALGVQAVGATHCTGEEAIELFRRRFGTRFIELGTGRVVER
jgi:7,8-dihydropterin-6-yl-methyl-4-(beta-D-ribofuranosyl)aminobenzene 5'-phosphate synthase